MIPANGAPHDLGARDVLRSLPFAQRRAGDHSLGKRRCSLAPVVGLVNDGNDGVPGTLRLSVGHRLDDDESDIGDAIGQKP